MSLAPEMGVRELLVQSPGLSSGDDFSYFDRLLDVGALFLPCFCFSLEPGEVASTVLVSKSR